MAKRVLSIQSHVVHGYVGNKSAVFPLQLLGFDVDIINSVHFSNHTGYGVPKGDVLNGKQLTDIIDGLEQNDLLDGIGHVLTGYIGSVSFSEAISNVLRTLRKHASFQFVCDPVLGDEGKFYVPPELVEVYKHTLIPMADVVTPNQFEVEKLTGIVVRTVVDVRAACRKLHDMGPAIVVITSAMFINEETTSDDKDGETISIFASRTYKDDDERDDELWRVDCPLVPGKFTGTGDLTAALLLGYLSSDPNDLAGALEKVSNTMYVVIKRTHETSGETMKSKELKLIQSKRDIEEPPSIFKARRI